MGIACGGNRCRPKAFCNVFPLMDLCGICHINCPLPVKNKLLCVRRACRFLNAGEDSYNDHRRSGLRSTRAAAKDTPQARNDTCALEVSVQGKLDGSIFEPRGITSRFPLLPDVAESNFGTASWNP